MFDIQEELKKLPEQAGVYLMKNSSGNVIYVGKAKILKNRVRQYFQNNIKHKRTEELVSNIESFEYIVTQNEVEALILECNLIHKYMPKYNIIFKDGKGYPFIKITTTEKYPRIMFTRYYKKDGNKYFGQYVEAKAVHEVIDLVKRVWKIRGCTLNLPRDIKKGRPCLNYHIKKCSAPCGAYIDEEEYNKSINEVIDFLNGDNKGIISNLKKDMVAYSENLEFEKAAIARDKINAVERLAEKQKAYINKDKDADVIGMAKDEKQCVVEIFLVRDGKLLGRDQFVIDISEDISRINILEEFLKQNYTDVTYIPKNIIIEKRNEEFDLIEENLSSIKGSKVKLIVPQKGENLKYLNMANENARISLTKFGDIIKKEQDRTIGALDEIKKALKVAELNRIEAYDISNTSGVMSVGSMIVFENGKPKRADYRKFKIKGVLGPNDYASIEEVLTRRFDRYFSERDLPEHKRKFAILPDIIFIDGGKGQVTSVKRIINKFNLNIQVAGMVKDDNHRTKGLLYNDVEVNLPKTSEGFKLLTRIQDEVHRFAISYHKKLMESTIIKSELDNIPGIGKKRKMDLLKKFGSVEEIKKATYEEIVDITSINSIIATEIIEFFKQE